MSFPEIYENPLLATIIGGLLILALASTGALGAEKAPKADPAITQTAVTYRNSYATRELASKGLAVQFRVTVIVRHQLVTKAKRKEMRSMVLTVLNDICEDGACSGALATSDGKAALADDFRREFEKIGIRPQSISVTYRSQKRRA